MICMVGFLKSDLLTLGHYNAFLQDASKKPHSSDKFYAASIVYNNYSSLTDEYAIDGMLYCILASIARYIYLLTSFNVRNRLKVF